MIKNLVFDMGDVLLSYRWMQIMYDHGLSEEETNEFWDKFFKDGNWVYYDNGTYNTKEFEKFMSEKYPEQAENIHYLLTNLSEICAIFLTVFQFASPNIIIAIIDTIQIWKSRETRMACVSTITMLKINSLHRGSNFI